MQSPTVEPRLIILNGGTHRGVYEVGLNNNKGLKCKNLLKMICLCCDKRRKKFSVSELSEQAELLVVLDISLSDFCHLIVLSGKRF